MDEQAIKIQADIAALLDQIITIDQLRAMFPYADGRLVARPTVIKWFYDANVLGRYAFKVGNTPCVLREHIKDWKPPFKSRKSEERHVNDYAAVWRKYDIGAKIRLHRENVGRSMTEVAKSAGLSTNYLGDIELGRTVPPFETLVKIEKGLGVYPRWSKGKEITKALKTGAATP